METPHGVRWAFRRNGIDYGDWLAFPSYEACRAIRHSNRRQTMLRLARHGWNRDRAHLIDVFQAKGLPICVRKRCGVVLLAAGRAPDKVIGHAGPEKHPNA